MPPAPPPPSGPVVVVLPVVLEWVDVVAQAPPHSAPYMATEWPNGSGQAVSPSAAPTASGANTTPGLEPSL